LLLSSIALAMGSGLFGGGASLWLDSWDGYAATRDRLLGHIRDHGIDNVVVLTGDVHSSCLE
ncbi:alkaline phosphatase D family protein, partial [Proteus mirabilis]|uniref:alkaline phosphatase D family protein n=1 Tax=Proteus mirabilis TaxID=584 RepID=UPI00195425BA